MQQSETTETALAIVNGELLVDSGEKVGTMLKDPLIVGTKWETFLGQDSVSKFAEHEILSVSDEISTLSGIYKDVIRIRTFLVDDEESFTFYAKGVGIVKWMYGSAEGGPHDSPTQLWQTIELKQFSN